MEQYYINNIITLLREEDIQPEVLGFIYWLLFRLCVNEEV